MAAHQDYRFCRTRKEVEAKFREFALSVGLTEPEIDRINEKFRRNYGMWSASHAAFMK